MPVLTVGGYPLSKALLTDLTKLRPPFDAAATPAHFGKELALEWHLHRISPPNRHGYNGALFSAVIDGKPHYFIYHQGTNNMKDVPSFLRLANIRPPQQMAEARAFQQSVRTMLAQQHPGETVPLIQVGYSLGAAIAILASDNGQPVIAFDPPGTKKLLQSMGRDTSQMGQHILEILSPHENLANSHGEHVGQILKAGEKFWKTDKVSLGDFISMSLQTHRIKNLGLALASMQDFSVTSAQNSGYPSSVWDAANIYLHENLGKRSSFGERLLASAVNFACFTRLDTLLTKIAVSSADMIAGRFSRQYAGISIQQEYPRQAPAQLAAHSVAPLMAQPAVSFTKRLENEPQDKQVTRAA